MAANERTNVKTYPTASSTDVLFYVLVDSNLPKNKLPEYGTSYRECLPHASEPFPNHELVFIAPDDGSGKQKWYFAADRANQDTYNYEQDGDAVLRTYIVRRSLYGARPVGVSGALSGEFLHPPAGSASPDAKFPAFCFADDTLVRLDRDLDSLYVAVRRRFIRPVTVEHHFDNTFRRYVKTTKEVIPPTDAAPTIPAPGITVEIQDGNHYHDIRITRELVLVAEETYPYALPAIPLNYDRRFPSRLDSVDLVAAWASADSTGAAFSYSEDYYFKFKITDARQGPYPGVLERWITNDPDAVKTANPLTPVPQAVSESIAVVAAWFHASTDGNSTFAIAKEWVVPSTIHPEVPVNLGGSADTSMSETRSFTETLAATPGYAAFVALTSCTVDYRVRELPFGLYEVGVVKINITGLYS